jgi:hypothetical protein
VNESPDYIPYYCEENIWRLLSRPEFDGADAYAFFVFGAAGRVAVFGQRAGDPGAGGLALWDYHVVAYDAGRGTVMDFDAVFGFDTPAAEYLEAAFGPLAGAGPEASSFLPRFRAVPAAAFRSRFDSDRSHMVGADGRWQAPPPPWPRPAAVDPYRALRLGALIDPASRFPDLPGSGAPLDLEGVRTFIGS